MAVPPEEAERRCRRALMEAWTGRESAVFRLPPSRLALDPADVVSFSHDGRARPSAARLHRRCRRVEVSKPSARIVTPTTCRRARRGPRRSRRLSCSARPEAVLLDLPQLTEDQPAHRPFAAAHAVPWPGEIAVFRSPSTGRVRTADQLRHAGPARQAGLGLLRRADVALRSRQPPWWSIFCPARWKSVTDLTLFGGANALAIESAPGIWEIVQAGAAELLAPGRYRLTRLLRGQRGHRECDGQPGTCWRAGRDARRKSRLAADRGGRSRIPWNWRIGPASRPVSKETYVAQAFTPEGRRAAGVLRRP